MLLSERYSVLILFCYLLFSCNSEKRYEDYNENEFYETQGFITKVFQTPSVFDDSSAQHMNYSYCVGDSLVFDGKEREILNAWQFGAPIVVLVHKKNPKISFYARRGFIDDVTKKQEENLFKVLLIEAEKQKIKF